MNHMDSKNRFHTSETWFWARGEQIALLVGLLALLFAHLEEVSWPRFLAVFIGIDLVGYLPGAIATRRGGGRRIGRLYHHLYNLTHSYFVGALSVGLWALVLGRIEWAMLAVPMHLAGDRGLFGNFSKPAELPFEPVAARGSIAPALDGSPGEAREARR